MRGRKPKPTVQRIAEGNREKRPINLNEPKPAALSTACPEELAEPDEQREWHRGIVPAIRRGQITSDDRTLAIAHCALWATWRSQLMAAAKHAHVIAGPNNTPMQNPARNMAHRTLQLLIKIDAELALTPTARTRISVDPKLTTTDPLEAAMMTTTDPDDATVN